VTEGEDPFVTTSQVPVERVTAAVKFTCRCPTVTTVGSMGEREERFVAVRRALDESDREERMKEDRDIDALAAKWEKVISKMTSSDES
jgi:hypothetical protein